MIAYRLQILRYFAAMLTDSSDSDYTSFTRLLLFFFTNIRYVDMILSVMFRPPLQIKIPARPQLTTKHNLASQNQLRIAFNTTHARTVYTQTSGFSYSLFYFQNLITSRQLKVQFVYSCKFRVTATIPRENLGTSLNRFAITISYRW